MSDHPDAQAGAELLKRYHHPHRWVRENFTAANHEVIKVRALYLKSVLASNEKAAATILAWAKSVGLNSLTFDQFGFGLYVIVPEEDFAKALAQLNAL